MKVLDDLSALVVEDDPVSKEVIARFFEKKGAAVLTASDGEEGLRIYGQHQPDLVVADIRMPKMDGLSLAVAIKADDPNAKIILITADDTRHSFKDIVSANVDGFLLKPIIIDQLQVIVRRIAHEIRQKKEVEKINQELIGFKNAVDLGTIVSYADLQGNITYVNDNFCKISGYQREELIGQPHNIVRHPSTPSTVFESLWNTIQDKKVWRGRITNKKKDGGRYIVETTIVPLLNDQNEVTEYFSIRKDVTEFVELGRKQRAMEQERIVREKEHYKQLNDSKTRFLTILTHELKTPLNGIINLSDFVINRIKKSDLAEKEELLEYLFEVHKNGQLMLEQIINVLELTRLKLDQIELHPSLVDLKVVVEDVIGDFRSEIESKKINSQLELSESIFTEIDAKRLKEILNNLLSNAIKYGNKKIKILLHGSAEHFEIIIEDNGSGIQEKEKVFEMFEQPDDTSVLTRNSQGVGVGLHLVKLLSEKMQIQVKIEDSQALGGAKIVVNGKIKK